MKNPLPLKKRGVKKGEGNFMAFLFGKSASESEERLKMAEEVLEYGLGTRDELPAAAKKALKKSGGGRDKAVDYVIKECLDVTARDHDNLNAHLLLVKAFGAKGPEYRDAQATHLKRACELAADTAKGKAALLASIKGVKSELGPGFKTFDEELSNWYVKLGDLYYEMEKREDALAQYDKAIAQEPANPVPYGKMTTLLIKMGQVNRARDMLKEVKGTIYYQKSPSFKKIIDEALATLPS